MGIRFGMLVRNDIVSNVFSGSVRVLFTCVSRELRKDGSMNFHVNRCDMGNGARKDFSESMFHLGIIGIS